MATPLGPEPLFLRTPNIRRAEFSVQYTLCNHPSSEQVTAFYP